MRVNDLIRQWRGEQEEERRSEIGEGVFDWERELSFGGETGGDGGLPKGRAEGGSAAAGEPTNEGAKGDAVGQEAAKGENVDLAGGVVETVDGSGAEESGDGSDEGGGIGGGAQRVVVGEGGGSDVGDVAEQKTVHVAKSGGEALDHGGQGWPRYLYFLQWKVVHVTTAIVRTREDKREETEAGANHKF